MEMQVGLYPLRRRDAYQQLTELKRQEGKDILITGSRTRWNDLLAHNLVDEIHLLIGNLVLEQGVPVFEGQTPTASFCATTLAPHASAGKSG